MTSRTRLEIQKTDQYRIFPVSWAWYEHNPIAQVQITNAEPNSITDIRVSVFMDSYMSGPHTFATLPNLPQGGSATLPVTALFNEVMTDLIENVNASGTVQVEYRSLGARRAAIAPVQMPIFHRNAFSWEDDRRAAAFVSPRDFAALAFARYVGNAVHSALLAQRWLELIPPHVRQTAGVRQGQISAIPENVLYAAALFEALRLYGVSYVVVPATSYRNISGNEAALDNVSYPYQALYYRGGDCTYLSILFCSMLEALDIETAFITIPGHLYAAFVINDDNWLPDSEDIIEHGGKRWLPVELTVPEQGFSRAWRIGARQWHNYGGLGEYSVAALHPIREAWELYPPVTIPASAYYAPEMPDRNAIIHAMEMELRD
jgi:hypothetical protein